jgi:hypothetical protein
MACRTNNHSLSSTAVIRTVTNSVQRLRRHGPADCLKVLRLQELTLIVRSPVLESLLRSGKMPFTIPCAERYRSESLGAKRPVPKVTSFPPPASRSNPHVQSLNALVSPLCFLFTFLPHFLSRLSVFGTPFPPPSE